MTAATRAVWRPCDSDGKLKGRKELSPLGCSSAHSATTIRHVIFRFVPSESSVCLAANNKDALKVNATAQ